MTVQDTANEKETPRSGLVLDSLEVKNFRAFKHLTIEKLGRVNLITGKNNVGKSSLLEAIWLYSQRASPYSIRQLIEMRGSHKSGSWTLASLPTSLSSDELLDAVLPLFHNADDSADPDPVEIGPVSNIDSRVALHLSWLVDFQSYGEAGVSYRPVPRSEAASESASLYLMANYGLPVVSRSRVDGVLFDASLNGAGLLAQPCEFVASNGLDVVAFERLYDDAVKTRRDDKALEALQIISPSAQRLFFSGQQRGLQRRGLYVFLDKTGDPMPLTRLGDGANRLVGIALAILNAQSGFILIDEIENGIHHTVLLDLWRFIFELASRFDVQVFVTTHSWECVEAFQEAAAEDEDPESGMLVRLQNKGGDVTSTIFDERRLGIVARDGIEVR